MIAPYQIRKPIATIGADALREAAAVGDEASTAEVLHQGRLSSAKTGAALIDVAIATIADAKLPGRW